MQKTLNRTNIEWVKNPDGSKGYVWNPVWGCRNNCPYCYARNMARRFGKTEDERAFKPTWIQSNFDKAFPKKPSKIFVNSMSEIVFWDREWMYKILERIEDNQIHTFLFLTKNPTIYSHYYFPDNCWLGTTITNQSAMNSFADLLLETTWDETNKIFLSVEPILEKIRRYVNPDWFIIGAETGSRKGKIIPQKEWIEKIICKFSAPIFLKDNLIPVMGKEYVKQRQEFPE